MTKREMFENIANLLADNTEVVDFCNHEIELLSRKSTKKTMTSAQKANVGLKDAIVETLESLATPVRVSDIMGIGDFVGLSNQKLSALMNQLATENRLTKTIFKGKSYFAANGVEFALE